MKDGGDTLEGGRDSPRPRRVDFEGAEGTPSGNDGAERPERVVEGSQRSTVGGVGQFDNQHCGAILGKSETEADEETGADKHSNALGGGLEDSSDNLSISTVGRKVSDRVADESDRSGADRP